MAAQDDQLPEFMLAFVGLFDTDASDGFIGAAMVTSERGYPLEFRVTTPVRPSPVQKALYGKSLEPYVETELIVRRLVSEIQRAPDVVLLNRVSALDAESPYPVAFVSRADEFVRTSGDGLEYRRLEPAGAAEGVLALVASSLSGDKLDACVERVSSAMRHFDPIEAFDRMKTALGVLAESDARYR